MNRQICFFCSIKFKRTARLSARQTLKAQSSTRHLAARTFLPFSKVLILIPRDENGVASYIETENYFFNGNIYLNWTEGFTLNEGDIPECMNEYFASIYTTENFDNYPSFDQVI